MSALDDPTEHVDSVAVPKGRRAEYTLRVTAGLA